MSQIVAGESDVGVSGQVQKKNAPPGLAERRDPKRWFRELEQPDPTKGQAVCDVSRGCEGGQWVS